MSVGGRVWCSLEKGWKRGGEKVEEGWRRSRREVEEG